MTPDQKRAAGKGVVGYLRVSAAGQTEGWSLGSQEQAIRAWAARHRLPVIALEQAPEGHESGARAFDDRRGWQAIERHIASGQVGWIAVAAIDRLSRDLGDMADRVRMWIELDIAIVAPAQGYDQVEGIGPFLLHLWGCLADHERKRLLGRILPGMQARLEAGLPLGTQPYGYRVVTESSVAGQRPRRHLVPDPETAPVVERIFAQALANPSWGSRRLAQWAGSQWPQASWSPGRLAKMLANPIYRGDLDSSVGTTAVTRTGNHPAIISPGEFARVQQLCEQRQRDRQDGFSAVHASSWLGGIAHCGRCGGEVGWRSGAAGTYGCLGSRGANGQHGCGAVWPADIETFVWRAIERVLEQDVRALRQMAATAIDRLPGLLDQRRQKAHAEQTEIARHLDALTERLVADSLSADAYNAEVRTLTQRRQAAQALLAETDGWTYLARLVAAREGAHSGAWRWVPVQAAVNQLDMPERRRLLRAVATRVTLQDAAHVGSLDGPSEDPAQGRFQGVTLTLPQATGGVSVIALGMAKLLAQRPGWDMGRTLTVTGWVRSDTPQGPRWRHASGQVLDLQPMSEAADAPCTATKTT
jgi:DNA invertase Pin-like site-specific DNA recombinase